MLDARMEAACRVKAELDDIYAEMISIIDAYECGPEGEPQWTEAQAYMALFQKE